MVAGFFCFLVAAFWFAFLTYQAASNAKPFQLAVLVFNAVLMVGQGLTLLAMAVREDR